MYQKMVVAGIMIFALVLVSAAWSATGEPWAYYPGGSSFEDMGTQGNDGEIHGPITEVVGAAGEDSMASYFDGRRSYVLLADNVWDSLTQGTINFWVKPDRIESQIILQYRDRGSSGQYVFLKIGNSGDIKFNVKGDVLYQTSTAGGIATIGEWMMITVTCDGVGETRIYVNGEDKTLIGSHHGKWFSFVAVKCEVAAIGAKRINDSYFGDFFQGAMDEMRIYNYVLSLIEIQQLYMETGRFIFSDVAMMADDESVAILGVSEAGLPVVRIKDLTSGVITESIDFFDQGWLPKSISVMNHETGSVDVSVTAEERADREVVRMEVRSKSDGGLVETSDLGN